MKVGASPDWAQKQLRAIGLQPINNVVDATNLVLHEFGNPPMPLTGTTLEEVKSECARPSKAKRSPPSTDKRARSMRTTWSYADNEKPMCLAGVYGGAESGVSDSTTKVVLEAAWFHPVTVEKRQASHTEHRRQLPL